ncbi:MAG: hypothetical protein KAJ76_00460 [Candidatus Heimdallarchaeota archaeon]|nr:hypothetical protein [Candidatus Heimdallarchaeota archaeon]MCK5297344.1 hypothetical protein [Candidatus Heimdallarchaeota archaeon]
MIKMSKLLIKISRNLHSLVIVSLNLVIAILIPVTTFCIDDVRIRNASRIIEGITAGILLIYFVIVFFPKTKIVRLSIDFITILLQLFLLLYIGITVGSNCDIFLSAKMGLGVAGVTLTDRVIEIVIYFLMKKKNRKMITVVV